MSKKIIAIVCIIVVLCSCLIVPTIAINYTIDTSISSNELVESVSGQTGYDNNLVVAINGTKYISIGKYGTYSEEWYFVPVFVNNKLYIISTLNNISVMFRQGWTGASGSSSNEIFINNSDLTSELYYGTASNSSYNIDDNWTCLTKKFTDIGSACDYASGIINGSESNITFNSIDLPAGNVAYIKTNGAQILDLSTTFIQYSQLFSDTWANITQKISYEANLPVGNVTFPLNGMSNIQWIKSGSTNILGQTQYATTSYQTTSNQYFVIYNPLYQQYGQGDNYDMNGTIHINGEMTEIKVYPLSGSVVTGQGLVSSSDSGYGSFYEIQDDGNGNPGWVDQSGNVSSGPQTGGTSLLPQEATIQTLASQILNIITKVGQSIANIFNVGHSAIVTLVGHASEFVTHFQSLYSWLPADIFAVLSSAIILAITIGIIKVFI